MKKRTMQRRTKPARPRKIAKPSPKIAQIASPRVSLLEINAGVLEAMRRANTPPEIVYAYRKTRMLLTEANKKSYPRQARAEWNAAIDEYYALMEHAPDDVPDPRAWHSELPEFLVRPITKEDHGQVLECLEALDSIMRDREMTVLARIELAATLLAAASATAYESAESMGTPALGPERYAQSEDLILRRAREIYAQGRV